MTNPGAVQRSYKGSMTNTDRWDEFKGRPGDVFVCTPPKCGTTWTSTIVTMLCQNSTDIAPQGLIHWVDAAIVPIEDVVNNLAVQKGQRCIKTHTPFNGIPYHNDAYYIAVYRHPIDVFFSLRKHYVNQKCVADDDPYLSSPDESLKLFVESPVDPENFDFDCLTSFINHYRSFAKNPRPGNLLFLHYADLLADPGGAISQIARHIGLNPDTGFLEEVTKATSFDNMKSRPDRFTPYADRGFWHDPKQFFHSAGTGKWVGQISDATLALYQQKMTAELPEAEVEWLEHGNSGP